MTDDSEVAHTPAMVEVRTPIAARLSMMAAAEASTTSPLGGCSPAGDMVSRTMVVRVFSSPRRKRDNPADHAPIQRWRE